MFDLGHSHRGVRCEHPSEPNRISRKETKAWREGLARVESPGPPLGDASAAPPPRSAQRGVGCMKRPSIGLRASRLRSSSKKLPKIAWSSWSAQALSILSDGG